MTLGRSGWHTFAVVENGASSKIFVDNGSTPAASGDSGAGSPTATVLGVEGDLGGNGYNSDMGTMLFVSGDVSASLPALFAVLKARWGTP